MHLLKNSRRSKKNFWRDFIKKRITKIMLLIKLEDFATIWYNITFTAIVLQQHVHRYMVDLYFVLPVKNTFRITMFFFTKILSRSQNQSFYQKLIFKKDKDNKVWILPLLCASFFQKCWIYNEWDLISMIRCLPKQISSKFNCYEFSTIYVHTYWDQLF